jgi:diadenosine tetraphosphate (Ap4A) HIT family hydrolase
MNNIFRTPEQQAKYEAYKAAGNLDQGCVLCTKEPLREFQHWRIIENMFPYDKVAGVHHMILPKRHVLEPDLSEEEIAELRNIKEEHFPKNYDFIIEAMPKMKSIPQHFHIHLIVVKD